MNEKGTLSKLFPNKKDYLLANKYFCPAIQETYILKHEGLHLTIGLVMWFTLERRKTLVPEQQKLQAVKHASNKTGFDRHIPETGHSVQWNAPEVLKYQPNWIKRKSECLRIPAMKETNINSNLGSTLSESWNLSKCS